MTEGGTREKGDEGGRGKKVARGTKKEDRERERESERKEGERCRLALVIQTNLRASKVKMISNQRISRQHLREKQSGL